MTDFKFNGDWETVLSLDKLTLLQNDKFFEYSKDLKEKLQQGFAELRIFDSLDNNPDPSNEQLEAIRFIQTNEELLLQKIFEYVKDVIYPFQKTLIDDEEWNFPKLDSQADLENVLGLISIDILNYSKQSTAYFAINFKATWDNEHGAHILFHKDRILDTGESWGFDIKKVCEDCGSDYEQSVYEFNHWDDNISEFIIPNPKYGKLKPNQIRSNETLPYRLIKNNFEEIFYNYVIDGSIEVDYNKHGHSLFSAALQAENLNVLNFLIKREIKNFNNVDYVLRNVKSDDIKRVAEKYYEANK